LKGGERNWSSALYARLRELAEGLSHQEGTRELWGGGDNSGRETSRVKRGGGPIDEETRQRNETKKKKRKQKKKKTRRVGVEAEQNPNLTRSCGKGRKKGTQKPNNASTWR